jgi:peptidoglycan hydrolase-like protein with peptidoglycan-binding domain
MASQPTDDGERVVQPLLVPGTSGFAVVELKRRLRHWYESRGEPLPRRLRGPVYGTSAVEAVKRFQRENGLKVDGIVGAETWRALPDG